MLTLRSEQMAVFGERVDAAFQQRLMTQVGRLFPARVAALGVTATRLCVRHGVARARDHGLGTERQVAAFVALLFLVGPGLDTRPWAQRVLGDPKRSPAERLRRLQTAVRHHGRGD